MLKDITGSSGEVLELDTGTTLGCLFGHYAARFPDLERLRSSIMLARNHDFGAPETSLSDGDEVAFLPPVSGGSGPYSHEITEDAGHFFALTREPIDTRALIARLERGEDGAVVAFEGVVRNNTRGRATLHLEYECYEPMAVRMMAAIGLRSSGLRSPRRDGARLGRLEIGEASVVIV
jgi:molybdopterin synthase catalytic subunit